MAAPTSTTAPSIQSRKDFKKTPAGQQEYWRQEMQGAQKMLDSWHRQADRIHKRYLNEGRQARDQSTYRDQTMPLNLFYSNVQTLISILYGRIPEVDVKRRYADANDDIGRVAGVILERLLNNDMDANPTQYDSVLRAVLEDRLIPGLGCSRVRYQAITAQVEVGAVLGVNGEVVQEATTQTVLKEERSPVDYFHWRDLLWSWARTPNDLRWMAFRTWITQDEATERYGEQTASQLEYKQHRMIVDEKSIQDEPEDNDYWLKAEIWDVWDKESRKVIEFNFGAQRILKSEPDRLNLEQFFPCPPFLIANATTSLYKPTPDFHLSEDLYNEIDKLQTRIAIITEAVRVVGVYDKSTEGVERMLTEGIENSLIPVDKWALMAEKGGLKGVIDWFPIEAVVNTLLNLRQLRDETIELLYQTSGMADVMRGTLANEYEGVGQTSEKVKFGSVRVQKLQEEYASFASGLMALKAEIICKHFEPSTIYEMSNARALMEDPQLVEAAVMLLKDWKKAKLRVEVASESLALVDYARLRTERGEFLTGMSGFIQAMAPMIQADPTIEPLMMQMLQWTMSGYRGADEIEGVLDKAIAASQQKAQQEQGKPDPEAAKAQAQMQLEQAKTQGQLAVIQAKSQADMALRQQDMQADIQTRQAEHQMQMAEQEAELRKDAALIQIKAMADVETEEATSAVNAAQQAAGVEAEMNKDLVLNAAEMESKVAETALEIQQARAVAKIPKPETKSKE